MCCCNVGTVVGHVSTCCLDTECFPFSSLLWQLVATDANVSSEYLTPEREHFYYIHPPADHLEGGRD
jgi:hypothetical protein